MKLKNYTTTDTKFWKGRIDDLEDTESFRIHQVIQLLDLDNSNTLHLDKNKVKTCLLGYCCNEGIIRNLGRIGAKQGPQSIRNRFANLPASFDNEVQIYDAGNLYCAENNLEEIQKQLEIAVEKLLNHNFFPIVLGGGHDVAFGHYNGIFNYVKKQHKKAKIGIINFDAHFDLRPYKEQGSSGTMFTQIADKCAKENQEFNYLCLGIQASGNTKSLFNKADSLGVQYVFANEFIESNYEHISAKINSFINNNDYIYITLCSDVFNAASAPGVSDVQPFGLYPIQILTFIKEVLKSKKVISFDVAEVSPPLDQDERTAKLAAIIIHSIITNLS